MGQSGEGLGGCGLVGSRCAWRSPWETHHRGVEGVKESKFYPHVTHVAGPSPFSEMAPLSKRECFVAHLLAGILAAGGTIPELRELWILADRTLKADTLLKQGE